MPSERPATHNTEFPQDSVSPLHLYTALYTSRVEEITQFGLLPTYNRQILTLTDKCHFYQGNILRRNTEYMEVYFCGPLTSAGAIRIPHNQKDSFRQNVVVAEVFRDALITQFMKEVNDLHTIIHTTIPGHVGMRKYPQDTGWKEGDYNSFWLYYLSGIDPVSARRFNEKESTKKYIRQINSKLDDRSLYKLAYQGFVDDFIEFVNAPENGCRLNKISKIVALPDYKHSFGSQMEKRLADGIGIVFEEAYVNPNWIREQQKLWFVKHSENINQLDGLDFILPIDNRASTISLLRLN